MNARPGSTLLNDGGQAINYFLEFRLLDTPSTVDDDAGIGCE
jgi:hypothetical protein